MLQLTDADFLLHDVPPFFVNDLIVGKKRTTEAAIRRNKICTRASVHRLPCPCLH